MAVTAKAKGSRGISAFIVERGTPGCRPGRKEDKLGMRASETSEVSSSTAGFPPRSCSGRRARGSSTRCRCWTPDASASRRWPSAWRRARTRRPASTPSNACSSGSRLGRFQSVRAKLVESATRIHAARLLTYRAAALKDAGARTTLVSAMAKLYSSEIAVRVSEDAVQIHGGYGFVKDYPAEKFFRDVKLTTIGEGTSEIQRLVIARQLLALEKERGSASHRPDDLRGPRARAAIVRAIARAISGGGAGRAGRARAGGAAVSATGAARSSSASPARPAAARARSSIGWSAIVRARTVHRGASSPSIPSSPFTRRGGAGRPGPDGRPRRTIRRVHPQHGDAGTSRRAVQATADAVAVLDAAGRDVIIVETVGVGQDEVEVMRLAAVTVLVLVPGMGDDVQALKAGVMEIADVFVVNKADRPDADRVVDAVESQPGAATATRTAAWRPPVLKTEALAGWAWTTCGTRSAAAGHQRRAVTIAERERERSSSSRCARPWRGWPPSTWPTRVTARRMGARRVRRDGAPTSIRSGRRSPAGARLRHRPRTRPDASRPGSRRHRRGAPGAVAALLPGRPGPATSRRPKTCVSQSVRAHLVPLDRARRGSNCSRPRRRRRRSRGSSDGAARACTTSRCAWTTSTRRWRTWTPRGVRLVDDTPRVGAGGALIAFIHPQAAHGVLVELKQVVGHRARLEVGTPLAVRRHADSRPARRAVPAGRRRDVRRRARARCGSRWRRPTTATGFSWRCARCSSRRPGAGCSWTAASATRCPRRRASIYALDRTRHLDHALDEVGSDRRRHRPRAADAPALRSLRRRDDARGRAASCRASRARAT